MVKTYLGIEIGNLDIKFAVCTEDKIKDFVVERIPDNIVKNGMIVSWDAMTCFIKDKIKEHGITCKDVALVLPEDAAYVRRLLMPYMTVEQMKINLPYEFRDFITEEKDKYVYDYAVMGMVEQEYHGKVSKSIDIMAVAALKDLIEKYKYMLKRCKLKLRIVAPKSCAYQNLIRKHIKLHSTHKAGNYAILDIGHHTVTLRIFTEGKYETGREMEIGLSEITYAISDALTVDEYMAEMYKRSNENNILYSEACMLVYNKLALEVKRIINFFAYNYPDNLLDTLYVCGGGTSIEPLLQVIQSVIDLKVQGLDELFEGFIEHKEALLRGATAVGITWNSGE